MTLDEKINEAKITATIYEKEARKCIQHGGSFYEEKAKAFRESAKELEQVIEWLEELKVYREAEKWTPISDNDLPDTDVPVLVSDGVYVWIDELQEDYENGQTMYWWDSQNYFEFNDTAWMQLPKPYKKENRA